MDHPNIVKYIDCINDNEYFHIITEFYSGGEIFNRLRSKGTYTELEAANIVFDLLLAIKYCHENEIIHRDIKLENVLYSNDSTDAKIKLVDFGLSRTYVSTINCLV